MTLRVPRTRFGRVALVTPLLAASAFLLWWRGPDWSIVADAFSLVHWWWIVAALGLNLVSVAIRSLAWRTVINQALARPHPRFAGVFSAFAIGLLANAILPGRIGELARVAVLTRRLPRGRGHTATLLGTVVAHRLFDLFPALILIGYVLATARIPHWAITSLVVVAGIGVVLFAFALAGARFPQRTALDGAGAVRRLLATGRRGLGVMRAPGASAVAVVFQSLGWLAQLFAVYVAMRAFGIDAPLPAAGLVLLLMNVATIFPLWPGNIGLLQAAVALPLASYGVAYATGFAYGLGLQVLEMSVGVGVGLIFLTREGLSLETLRRMPEPGPDELTRQAVHAVEVDAPRPRTRIPS